MSDIKTESLKMARNFHRVYESLAPSYGHETQLETRVFDENSSNGQLMVAVCEEIIKEHIKPLNDDIKMLNKRRFNLMSKYQRLADEVEVAFKRAHCPYSG